MVGLLQAWKREGAGNIFARGRIGALGGLVRVERTAKVLWRAELISAATCELSGPLVHIVMNGRRTCSLAIALFAFVSALAGCIRRASSLQHLMESRGTRWLRAR